METLDRPSKLFENVVLLWDRGTFGFPLMLGGEARTYDIVSVVLDLLHQLTRQELSSLQHAIEVFIKGMMTEERAEECARVLGIKETDAVRRLNVIREMNKKVLEKTQRLLFLKGDSDA